jgi:arylsulfatase A-like enzyme
MLGGEDGLRPAPLWCGASGVILKEQADWLEGLREDRYKYVFEPYAAKPHEWLYDLEADPAEGRNLAAERREVAQAMRRRLEELKASRSGQAEEMDAAEDVLVRAKLEDLGYI